MSALGLAVLAAIGVGAPLLLRDWARARDARDYETLRLYFSRLPRPEPSICASARMALLRNSPAAPGLIAQCQALGGGVDLPRPAPPPGNTPAPVAPSLVSPGPVQRTEALLSPQQGPLYRVTVVVHFPLSLGVNADDVAEEARNHGFRDAAVAKSPPLGWPGARGDYYVTAHYSGEPKTMERSYAGGQVQIVDAWEGG